MKKLTTSILSISLLAGAVYAADTNKMNSDEMKKMHLTAMNMDMKKMQNMHDKMKKLCNEKEQSWTPPKDVLFEHFKNQNEG